MRLKRVRVHHVRTLEEFRAIPRIPFKDIPGNELLTSDVFGMSVDRDEQVVADLLKFFVKREDEFDKAKCRDFRFVSLTHCLPLHLFKTSI